MSKMKRELMMNKRKVMRKWSKNIGGIVARWRGIVGRTIVLI